jgi:hypothetical protein
MTDDDAGGIAGPLACADPRPARSSDRSADLGRGRRDPRTAVGEDEIVCLLCGAGFRQLTNTHLSAHGLSSLEYKRRFGYNLGRPLMCHALRRLYAERARDVGLAARIRRRPILVEPKLRRRGGMRAIALEETLTRQEIQRLPRRRWTLRGRGGRSLAGSGSPLGRPGRGDLTLAQG